MTRRIRRTRLRTSGTALTCMALACSVLAACGSSGGKGVSSSASTGSGGSASSTSESSAPTTAGSTSLTDVAAAAKYVGGKAGAADSSLKPVTIGFVDQSGGTPSFPEQAVAANAAVSYVNEDLGGIGGHPLKLSRCTISTSEEQGVNCAQQFLNNSAIPVITSGGLALGNQSLYQTLNGAVPLIDGNLSLPVDAKAKNAIMLDSGILGAGPGLVTFMMKYLKPKTVALVYPNLPQNSAAGVNTAKILTGLGVKVTTASFPAGATDLLSPLVAAGAKTADVVLPFVNTDTCAPLAKTLQQLGRTKPVVTLGLCIDPSVSKALGDYPKWTIYFPSENPYLPAGSANVRAFLSAMHKYAGKDANIAGFAGFTFAGVLTTARVLNSVGADKISRATVGAAIKRYVGPGFMLPPSRCGSYPQGSAICTLAGYVYTYDGNGKWTDPTGGTGIAPAA